MKRRYFVIIISVCLLAGIYCLPPVRLMVNWTVVIMAGRLGLPIERLARCLDVPLDDASAQAPRIGRYREFETEDPNYDVLIFNFDGARGDQPSDVTSYALRAIRRGGFKHAKRMTLLVFCNLTTTNKSHGVVYPFGLFLESATMKKHDTSTTELAKGPLIRSPMNWDGRIDEWIYSTNNTGSYRPVVTENPAFTEPAQVAARVFHWDLEDLKTRDQVRARFGEPKYFVEDRGRLSEVFLLNEGGEIGKVRIWYDGDAVLPDR
jgi:hypothetical protein